MFKKIIFVLSLSVIYFFFISVLSSRLNTNVQRSYGSWDLPYEGGAIVVQSYADSHLYLGLSVTKGQNLIYNGPGKAPRPYLHTPPGLGLTTWAMYHFFGYEGERTLLMTQILPLVTQTLSFILIVTIALIMTGSLPLSILASLIFTLVPMSIYMGHINEISIITLPFVLLSLIVYLYYLRKPSTKLFILLLITSTLSSFYCWTGFFILPVIGVHQLISSKFKPTRKQIFFIINCALWELILIFLLLGQIYWADNFSFNTLKEGFDRRVMGNSYSRVTVIEFLRIYLGHLLKYFTLPVCLTTLVFLIANIKNKLSKIKLSINAQIIIVSLFIGLGPVLSIPYQTIGPNKTIANEYWSFNLIPFFVLSTIMFFKYFNEKILKNRWYSYVIMFAFIATIFFSGRKVIYDDYTGSGKYIPEKGHFVEVFKAPGR